MRRVTIVFQMHQTKFAQLLSIAKECNVRFGGTTVTLTIEESDVAHLPTQARQTVFNLVSELCSK